MPKKPKRKLNIPALKRKFNHKKRIKGKSYDQIAHTSSIRKAISIKKQAKKQGYNARRIYHPLKYDKHHDVYIR